MLVLNLVRTTRWVGVVAVQLIPVCNYYIQNVYCTRYLITYHTDAACRRARPRVVAPRRAGAMSSRSCSRSRVVILEAAFSCVQRWTAYSGTVEVHANTNSEANT